MADLQTVIDLIFRADDQVSQTLTTIGNNLEALRGLGGSIEGLAQPFAALANQLIVAETAVLSLGAALIQQGVQAAGQFGSSIQFLSTLFTATSTELSGFKNDILAYASGSTASLTQITSALGEAIGAGIEWRTSLDLLRTAEQLSVAQQGELSTTTGLLVSTLNGYGLEVASVNTVADQFSVTIRDGKISIGELASGMSNVTPLASAAGVGLDQVGAAIATLTTQGFPAGSAITAVRNIIEGFINPTGQAAAAATAMGFSLSASTLSSQGLSGAMRLVANATGGSVEKMAQLFTTSEGLSGALALSGTGAARFAEVINNMASATGATETAFVKMGGSITQSSQLVANAVEVAFVRLGDPLLDEFNNVSTGVAQIFTALGNSFRDGGALRPLTQAFERWGQEIGTVINGIASNLPSALSGLDFSGMLSSLEGLGAEIRAIFSAFFNGLNLSTVDGLRASLQLVVNTFTSLTQVVTGIVAEFRPMAAVLGASVKEFNALDAASKLDFGSFLGTMKLIAEQGVAVGLALIGIGRAAVDVSTVVDGVVGGLQVIINALQVGFDGAALAVLATVEKIMEARLAIENIRIRFSVTEQGTQESQQRIDELKNGLDELRSTMDAVGQNLNKNKKELDEGWALAANAATAKTDAFNAKLDAAESALRKAGTGAQSAGAELSGLKDRMPVTEFDGLLGKLRQFEQETGRMKAGEELAQQLNAAGNSAFNLAMKQSDLKFKTKDAENAQRGFTREIIAGIPVYTQYGNKLSGAKQNVQEIGETSKKTAQNILETTREANSFKTKMEEIASNERIKNIDAVVTINTERLRADAERVKATFASIDNTVSSTGDLLASLYGELGKADRWTQLAISEQIDMENQRRQTALDLQQRLVEAEIARANAQASAYSSGSSMIQIQAAGLEPELEAFMWKILSKIRVQANAEFSNYLLGLA